MLLKSELRNLNDVFRKQIIARLNHYNLPTSEVLSVSLGDE